MLVYQTMAETLSLFEQKIYIKFPQNILLHPCYELLTD